MKFYDSPNPTTTNYPKLNAINYNILIIIAYNIIPVDNMSSNKNDKTECPSGNSSRPIKFNNSFKRSTYLLQEDLVFSLYLMQFSSNHYLGSPSNRLYEILSLAKFDKDRSLMSVHSVKGYF